MIINSFLFLLHLDHGFTKNDPKIIPMGCINKTKGIRVSVNILFICVQDLRGLVSHSNSSANCIPHHPTIIKPIHLKCGTLDWSVNTIATNEYKVVFALDSTL